MSITEQEANQFASKTEIYINLQKTYNSLVSRLIDLFINFVDRNHTNIQ